MTFNILTWRRTMLCGWLIFLLTKAWRGNNFDAFLFAASVAIITLIVGGMAAWLANRFPQISLDKLAMLVFAVLALLGLAGLVKVLVDTQPGFGKSMLVFVSPLLAVGLVVLSGILALFMEFVAQVFAGEIKKEFTVSERLWLVLETLVFLICSIVTLAFFP